MNLIHKQMEVKTTIERLAIQLGVNPTWATAIAMVESSLGVHQMSSTGCVGVFQMSSIAMKDLYQEMSKVDDELVDITCGLLFLRLLLKRHKSIEAATSAYCDPKDRPFYLDKVKSYMKAFELKSD